MERVYLDWNATTPPLSEVVRAMADASARAWGNPSSVHADGRQARKVVEDARAALAALAGVDPRDVVLTSGGTEANNLALRSAFAAERGVLALSRLEHPSVTRVAELLEREGRAELAWIGVTPEGVIDLEALRGLLASRPVRLIALQAVNHETGVIQPVSEAAALARAQGALVHVDAVQAWGKLDVPAGDTRAFAAHKVRGPKGIGAAFVRADLKLAPVLVGGAQERGMRPGTQDAALAAGVLVAARHAMGGPARHAPLASLRDRLESALLALRPGARVNGTGPRAPHVTNVFVPGWRGDELVAALDLEGVSVSSGSACSAGTSEPSPVLSAMHGEERAAASVRVSLGETTTEEDVLRAIDAFGRVLAR